MLSKLRPTHKIIPTGIQELDFILGGGLPRGKIVEIHGNYDSMKTILALKITAKMQAMDMIPAYIDIDRDLSEGYLKAAEIDTSKFVLLYLSKSADIISTIDSLTKDNLVNVIILDSMSLIDYDEHLISDGVKNVLSRIAGTILGKNCCVIVINQMRNNCRTRQLIPFCDKAFDTYSSIRMHICVLDKSLGEISLEVIKHKLGHSKEKTRMRLQNYTLGGRMLYGSIN